MILKVNKIRQIATICLVSYVFNFEFRTHFSFHFFVDLCSHEEEESEEEESEEEQEEDEDEYEEDEQNYDEIEEEYHQHHQNHHHHQKSPRSSRGVKNLTSMWNKTAQADEPNTSTSWKRGKDGTFRKSIQPKAMTKKEQRERDQMLASKKVNNNAGQKNNKGTVKNAGNQKKTNNNTKSGFTRTSSSGSAPKFNNNVKSGNNRIGNRKNSAGSVNSSPKKHVVKKAPAMKKSIKKNMPPASPTKGKKVFKKPQPVVEYEEEEEEEEDDEIYVEDDDYELELDDEGKFGKC